MIQRQSLAVRKFFKRGPVLNALLGFEARR